MRTCLIFFILLLTANHAVSQACGVYRVKYQATFHNDSLSIKEVRLPATSYLHGIEEIDSEFAIRSFGTTYMKLNGVMFSHLTSANSDPEYLIGLYKSKLKTIPVTIIAVDNHNREFTISTEIEFANLEFKLPPPDSTITLTIDLGTINF